MIVETRNRLLPRFCRGVAITVLACFPLYAEDHAESDTSGPKFSGNVRKIEFDDSLFSGGKKKDVEHADPDRDPEYSDNVQQAAFDASFFLPDPDYGQATYDPDVERNLYTKWEVPVAKPLFEFGRQQYPSGAFERASDIFGSSNLLYLGADAYFLGEEIPFLQEDVEKGRKGLRLPQTLIYGDWRTGVAYNDTGAIERSVLATRLNLEVDIRLTSSERIHALFTPFNNGGNDVSRWEFGGDDRRGERLLLNLEPSALFFEGDLARISQGFSGGDSFSKADIPFAVGLMPLFLQNGTWLFDAFTGVAVTKPAQNSSKLDISNMDTTFFAGFDRVSTGAIPDESEANIYGVTSFLDTRNGYLELGYGYTDGQGIFDDLSYHNMAVSWTKRYFGRISNSLRAVYNFGQDPDPGTARTADGVFLSVESSLITDRPLTFVPYLNLFAGFGTPQGLARDPGVGGLLFNSGILFESDGLTGFPTLDSSAHDTYGFAFGLGQLGGLDFSPTALDRTSYIDQGQKIHNKQLVLECAGVFSNNPFIPDQYGLGLRYQRAIGNAWLVRGDLMKGFLDDGRDFSGIKLELRRKF